MAAQDAAKDGQVIETLNDVFDIWAFESAIVPETGATMYTGIAAFADNAKDGDGVADPREFMIYVPTSAQVEGHKAPLYSYTQATARPTASSSTARSGGRSLRRKV